MNLRLITAAKADLTQIRDYTRREHGAAQAKVYMSALRASFKTLQTNPEIGFSIDHIREGYRCYAVKHHRIFYRIADANIIIAAVLHERQLPLRHLTQRNE